MALSFFTVNVVFAACTIYSEHYHFYIFSHLSSVLIFHDNVYLRTLEMMYHVVNQNISVVIQEIFKLREGNYNFRGLLMLSTKYSKKEYEIQM